MPDLKVPPERDFGFYQRRKHDKWRAVPVPEPALEGVVADSHAHLHMLPDPGWELSRCAANGVDFMCMIVDPSEDGSRPFDELDSWLGESDMRGLGASSAASSAAPVAPARGLAVPAVAAPAAAAHDRDPGASAVAPDRDPGASVTAPVRDPGVSAVASNRDPGAPAAAPARELGASVTAPVRDPGASAAAHGRDPGVSAAVPARELVAPVVRIAVGVHPHNAKLFDAALEAELVARLDDPRVAAVGEIGLDYHYDLSPRDVQRDVFRRQISIAQKRGLPIALHLRDGERADGEGAAGGTADGERGGALRPDVAPRGSAAGVAGAGERGAASELDAISGDDAAGSAGEERGGAGERAVSGGSAGGEHVAASGPDATSGGDAHAEAFEILREAGALGPRTLLHCCTLGPDELAPWIEAGCYIAYGGALTFKNADAVREGARLVPLDRLLLETDSPYMTPEPMRGAACTPAHVVFTAARLAEVRGIAPGAERAAFLERVHANTLHFYSAG